MTNKAVAKKAATSDRKPPSLGKPQKKPLTKAVRLAFDFELIENFEEARKEVKKATIGARANPTSQSIKAELEEANETLINAEAELKAESIEFKFRAVGRKSYERLISDHPLREENHDIVRREGQDPDTFPFDPESFPIALIAASMVEPEMSPEEAEAWLGEDNWSSSEVEALFTAAMEVNTSFKIINLGKG